MRRVQIDLLTYLLAQLRNSENYWRHVAIFALTDDYFWPDRYMCMRSVVGELQFSMLPRRTVAC